MPDEMAVLRAANSAGEALFTVHYACQNLSEVVNGPAAVNCVSFYDVRARAPQTFSMANVGTAETSGSQREVLLLQAAFKFMRDHSEARWIHWKMNRPEYGFQALASRLKWLGHEEPTIPPVDRRHDLHVLVADRYGSDFAAHPRLPNLLSRNAISSRYARWGAEEAELFARQQYMPLQQSVTEKVRLLADAFSLLVAGRLQTDNSAGDVHFADAHLDAVKVVLAIAERFVLVRRALSKSRRHDSRETIEIDDEYDAQDLLRALFVQFFEDVRDEEGTPSDAGAASRIDFLLPETRLAIEVKWMRKSLTEAKLGAELLVDRARYASHPDVGHLVCLVFDYDGQLPNPRGLERDLDQAATNEHVACTLKIIDR